MTALDGTYIFSLLGKPTAQSSVYVSGNLNGSSDKAVDGNTDNNYREGSCTHTLLEEENPWWAVDMEVYVTVFSVNLTNRLDCCCEYKKEIFFKCSTSMQYSPP